MLRELDPSITANGKFVLGQHGNRVLQPGFDYLIELLTTRFAPLKQEVQQCEGHDLFTFTNPPGDATDSVITVVERL